MEDRRGRKKQIKELEEISYLRTWKIVIREASSLFLCSLPFFKERIEIFRIEDQKTKSIGKYSLSPNYKKVAFTTYLHEKFRTIPGSEELYLINTDGSNLRKIDIDNVQDCSLIGFLGDNKFLLNGYLINETRYLFILDLNTKEIDVLDELGMSTVGKCYTKPSRDGNLFIYDIGKAFVIYNVKNKISRKIEIDGDRPILSPDGQWILFRRGGMTGSYYLIDVNGLYETLILSEKKIRALLRGSGGYRDLGFSSWSPDGKFILFFELSDLQRGKSFVLKVKTKEIVEVRKGKG